MSQYVAKSGNIPNFRGYYIQDEMYKKVNGKIITAVI